MLNCYVIVEINIHERATRFCVNTLFDYSPKWLSSLRKEQKVSFQTKKIASKIGWLDQKLWRKQCFLFCFYCKKLTQVILSPHNCKIFLTSEGSKLFLFEVLSHVCVMCMGHSFWFWFPSILTPEVHCDGSALHNRDSIVGIHFSFLYLLIPLAVCSSYSLGCLAWGDSCRVGATHDLQSSSSHQRYSVLCLWKPC